MSNNNLNTLVLMILATVIGGLILYYLTGRD